MAPLSRGKSDQLIEVWPGVPPSQSDPSTHFWYRAADSRYRRICDDSGWPTDVSLVSDSSRVYVPCVDCRGLYVEDLVGGEERLSPAPHVMAPLLSGPHPTKIWGSPRKEHGTDMATMPLAAVPIASFARFYDATGPQKVRIVRDSRL